MNWKSLVMCGNGLLLYEVISMIGDSSGSFEMANLLQETMAVVGISSEAYRREVENGQVWSDCEHLPRLINFHSCPHHFRF